MGEGRWRSSDWDAYSATHVDGKSKAEIFTSTEMKDEFNPALVQVRESRDSAVNPASTPIVLASDVTGSMGMVAHELMKKGLNTLAKEIYARRPVDDPHVMVMAIGDAKCDRAPLQVTQFEADIRLADQVKALWLEGKGGGNGGESYCAAHVFAATRTVTDAWEKRRRKGYLFTIGDEPVHDGMTRQELERVFGSDFGRDLSASQCVEMASRTYEVFHVVLRNEGVARSGLDGVLATWNPILPQRVILLDDYTKLAEAVVSAIQVVEGARKADVAASWSDKTSLVVANAIRDIAPRHASSGAVRLA